MAGKKNILSRLITWFIPEKSKLEPGFAGSLLLTAEHILGKVAGSVPVIGLFIASLGTLASTLWNFKNLSRSELGTRVLLGLIFTGLGVAVLLFPPSGLAIGLVVAGLSLVRSIVECVHHAKTKKNVVAPADGAQKQQAVTLKQKIANAGMSFISLLCISVSVLADDIFPAILEAFPQLLVLLLTVFILASLVYAIYTCKDDIRNLFTKTGEATSASDNATGTNVADEGEKLIAQKAQDAAPEPDNADTKINEICLDADRKWSRIPQIIITDADGDEQLVDKLTDEDERLVKKPEIIITDTDDEGESEGEAPHP
jgi:hypothetical protein